MFLCHFVMFSLWRCHVLVCHLHRFEAATSEVFTLYSWMMPFCMLLGGGSHETMMLEVLLCFTVATVTALGGALGTNRQKTALILNEAIT